MSLLYFAKVRKSVKKLNLEDLIRNLKNALSKAHKAADRDFLLKHLTYLQEKGLDNPATQKDLDFVIKDIEKTLGQKLESLAEAPFLQASMEAYTDGKRKVCKPFKIDYSLDDADLGALNTLDEFNGWYIRDKFSKDTSDIINRELGDLLERGGTKREFAQTLETALEDHVTDSKTYWELLADHTLTKIQNMGHVSGYETAGVQYVKIVAVIDSKTTPVCRAMNNKVFKVADFRKQYDKIIRAAEKHDLKAYKAAQPMVNGKAMKGEISDEDIKKLGIKLPPYHFRCRTTHVAYFEGERELRRPEKDSENNPRPKGQGNKQEYALEPWEEKLRLLMWSNLNTKGLLQTAKIYNVKNIEYKSLKKELSESEIIQKITCKGETKKSCVSLALAYIANKTGLDVTDARAGISRLLFALSGKNLCDITKTKPGITKNSLPDAEKILQKVKEGKEYLFEAREHAAIVRRKEGKLEFLELQNPEIKENGFKELKSDILETRFKCKWLDLDENGRPQYSYTVLIDTDKFKNNSEFKKIVGLFNTKKKD